MKEKILFFGGSGFVGIYFVRKLLELGHKVVVYDLKKPINNRVLNVEINGKPLDKKKMYKVGTHSFLAQGGDLYNTFLEGEYEDRKINLSEEIINYLKANKEIEEPKRGRLIPAQ